MPGGRWPRNALRQMQLVCQHSVVVVAGLLALAVAACGGEGDSARTMGATPSDDLEVIVPPERLLEDDVLSADEGPRAILADGRITFAEYEGAVLAMVACALEGNAELTNGELRLDATGSFVLAFSWDPADYATASRAVEECGARHLHPVNRIWSEARAGTLAESAVTEARDIFWECIEGAGVDLGDRPRSSESIAYVFGLPDGLRIVDACQERIWEEFGLPSFGG